MGDESKTKKEESGWRGVGIWSSLELVDEVMAKKIMGIILLNVDIAVRYQWDLIIQ